MGELRGFLYNPSFPSRLLLPQHDKVSSYRTLKRHPKTASAADARFTHVAALSFLSSSTPYKVLTRKKVARPPLSVAKTKALVKPPCRSVIFAYLQSHFPAAQFTGFGFDRLEQQTTDAPSAAAGGDGQIVNVDQRLGGERGKTSHANRNPYRAAVQPSDKNQRPRVSPESGYELLQHRGRQRRSLADR